MPVLEIYGDIGEDWWEPTNSITGKTVSAWLKQNAEGASEITVLLNSFGGAVNDGVAIYNLLNSHPARVTCMVLGFALSAASVVAMAGDEIQMLPGSMMMIHPASGFCMGTADDMTATANALRSMTDASAGIYAARTGKSKDDCLALMDAETWFQPDEALAAGFCDKVVDAKGKAQPIPASSRATQKWLQSLKRPPANFTQLLQARLNAPKTAAAVPHQQFRAPRMTAFGELASGAQRSRIGDL